VTLGILLVVEAQEGNRYCCRQDGRRDARNQQQARTFDFAGPMRGLKQILLERRGQGRNQTDPDTQGREKPAWFSLPP